MSEVLGSSRVKYHGALGAYRGAKRTGRGRPVRSRAEREEPLQDALGGEIGGVAGREVPGPAGDEAPGVGAGGVPSRPAADSCCPPGRDLRKTGEPRPVFSVVPSVHGGLDLAEMRRLGLDPAAVLDFSSNQSPLGACPAARQAVAAARLDAYPEREASTLAGKLAQRHGVDAAQVVVGSGSTELIRLLAQIALEPGEWALSLGPSFGEYRVATLLARAHFHEQPLEPAATGFFYDHRTFCRCLEGRPRVCWLCSPHNPTGVALPAAVMAELVNSFPQTIFVLDEAYCDLLDEPQWTTDLLALGNLVVLRSLTKVWGLAGLRLGYALAAESLAGPLRAAKAPWSVNACALAAGEAALGAEEVAAGETVGAGAAADSEAGEWACGSWYQRAIEVLRRGREQLMTGLEQQGWKALPSAAGFFLVEVGNAAETRQRLLEQGCLVRDCSSFGLPAYVRISPRLPEENDRLLAAFATLAPSGGTRSCL